MTAKICAPQPQTMQFLDIKLSRIIVPDEGLPNEFLASWQFLAPEILHEYCNERSTSTDMCTEILGHHLIVFFSL